jgi:hypothetical protein
LAARQLERAASLSEGASIRAAAPQHEHFYHEVAEAFGSRVDTTPRSTHDVRFKYQKRWRCDLQTTFCGVD